MSPADRCTCHASHVKSPLRSLSRSSKAASILTWTWSCCFDLTEMETILLALHDQITECMPSDQLLQSLLSLIQMLGLRLFKEELPSQCMSVLLLFIWQWTFGFRRMWHLEPKIQISCCDSNNHFYIKNFTQRYTCCQYKVIHRKGKVRAYIHTQHNSRLGSRL